MRNTVLFLGVAAYCSLLGGAAEAEVIEFQMNDANQWDVIQDPDASAEFGFDYSIYGIPEAPGGNDTIGVRLAANIDSGVASAIAISPKDFEASGTYTVVADIWLNYYADFGNVGTTEFGGLFVGVDAVDSGSIFGTGILGNTDGDTSIDYRMYNAGVLVDPETGQYDIASRDNTDPDLIEQFPGQDVPDEQTDFDLFDPPNEIVAAPDGTLAFGWHTFAASVDENAGFANFSIDGFSIGSIDASVEESVELAGPIAAALTDIFTSVAPVPEFAFAIIDNMAVDIERSAAVGDFDSDGDLDIDDIETLGAAILAGSRESRFDVNADGDVDTVDYSFWVTEIKNTWIGDSNLDGEFSSTDFVHVFQRREYEDQVDLNSTWDDGDWNGDGDFDSTDFVAAFTEGGYEKGPKINAHSVPEPTCLMLILSSALSIVVARRLR